jgi:ubiquinone/menaquinone biosynthesis C-methylase UbiE
MTVLSVDDGYAQWADAYDEYDNPLIGLETECLSSVLKQISPESVLDVGTGTGRHALAFAQRGSSVVGIDASTAMLAVAERKRQSLGLENVRFVQGSIESGLPIPAATFDLAICALTLCHVRGLTRAVSLLVDAVRPGGHIFITDLHPAAVTAGLGTVFSVDGSEHFIATVKHTRDGYLEAIRMAGATVIAIQERNLGDAVTSAEALPPAVAGGDWQRLPFCLAVLAQRLDAPAP